MIDYHEILDAKDAKHAEPTMRWRFERYHRGTLMAEGAEVSAETEDEAHQKARRLFSEYKYQNDKFVLVETVKK